MCIEWRIRNLPYPIETYSVTASGDDCTITVRTTNKKYFKKIHIPELTRCSLLPDQQLISLKHLHNTLIITVSHLFGSVALLLLFARQRFTIGFGGIAQLMKNIEFCSGASMTSTKFY